MKKGQSPFREARRKASGKQNDKPIRGRDRRYKGTNDHQEGGLQGAAKAYRNIT
jgi:hypothetical protein